MSYQIQTLNAISPAIYTQLGEHYLGALPQTPPET